MMTRALPIAVLAACFDPTPMLGQACSSWCPPPETCVAGTCALMPEATGSSDAAPPPPPPVTGNYVFVTSETKAVPDIGGPAGGDAWCNQLAATAHLPGSYTAWISAPGQHARDRLAATGARGWYRTDGLPFADTLDDLVGSGKMFYPPRYADTRVDLSEVTSTVATGTTADGSDASGFDCSGFSSPTGSLVTGSLLAGKMLWTDDSSTATCGGEIRIYCFGNTENVAVSAPPPATGRHAFITQMGVGISASGRDAIDATCASQAATAGLPGTYEALLPSGSDDAKARFAMTEPWVRSDNVITLGSDFTMIAPLDVDAFGVYQQGTSWLGEVGRDCTDWTTAGGTPNTADAGEVALGLLTAVGVYPCSNEFYAYCLEQ